MLEGPTRWAFLASGMIFITGTILFGVSMLRSRVLPRLAAVGYIVGLTALVLQAAWPESLLSSAIHVAACVSLTALARSVWPRTVDAVRPERRPLGVASS
ncbi:hypothetical protein ACFV7R_13005 [Streptomyces sp. NPDC059866]|uniref:hypothetical protein n=1 Tax=Streptomyces sp. NPDC059866 TaxID=3346978 RepID=UPI0036580DDE